MGGTGHHWRPSRRRYYRQRVRQTLLRRVRLLPARPGLRRLRARLLRRLLGTRALLRLLALAKRLSLSGVLTTTDSSRGSRNLGRLFPRDRRPFFASSSTVSWPRTDQNSDKLPRLCTSS